MYSHAILLQVDLFAINLIVVPGPMVSAASLIRICSILQHREVRLRRQRLTDPFRSRSAALQSLLHVPGIFLRAMGAAAVRHTIVNRSVIGPFRSIFCELLEAGCLQKPSSGEAAAPSGRLPKLTLLLPPRGSSGRRPKLREQ